MKHEGEKIKFTKVKPKSQKTTPPPVVSTPPLIMRPVSPVTQVELEEALFHFLKSLLDGRPRADRPLLVEAPVLCSFYGTPSSNLVTALRYLLDDFLVELGPDAAAWGDFTLSPALLGMALALYTCLTPLQSRDRAPDLLSDFGVALVATLPPARTLPEVLAYHALLRRLAGVLLHLEEERAELLCALLNRSPLTALTHLHLYTPPPLTPLAAHLLRGWEQHVISPAPWHGPEDWLAVICSLVENPALATYLRRCWLTLPETRPACRNLGLVLESLRRYGDEDNHYNGRSFILSFYEAYDHFFVELREDAWGETYRAWPILERAEQLLRYNVGDNDQRAIQFNRWGNEIFLKFRPLLSIIEVDGHPPKDFNKLSSDLIWAVDALRDWTTASASPALHLGEVAFTSEDNE